jgi:serpin B
MPASRVWPAERTSESDARSLVASNAAFGLDLYGQLRATPGNLFYSPYSISCALAMTYAGARGATADEMARTLRFSLPPDRLHPAFAETTREIRASGTERAAELHTANALWAQQGCRFESGFREIAQRNYGAALEEVDFGRATETARRTINAWVERETRDKIKDLIQEGGLTSLTVLVLTNAIYFKGVWMNAFHEEATRPGDFAGAQGAVRNVPLMHQQHVYPYLDDGTIQAIELPYQANELSMIILLPHKVDGLANVEKALAARGLTDSLARMRRTEVVVVLPRFKITAAFNLRTALEALGMIRSFQPQADFSGMFKAERVHVDAVIHKAHVDVNEKGTEAAAATAVAMQLESARRPLPPPPVFRADHPFVFFIRDNRTGSLLFAGRLTDPLRS